MAFWLTEKSDTEEEEEDGEPDEADEGESSPQGSPKSLGFFDIVASREKRRPHG
jgi:hypothetical protein